MSKTIHYSVITHPELIDIVDEAWAKDTLPDDGQRRLGEKGWKCLVAAPQMRPRENHSIA